MRIFIKHSAIIVAVFLVVSTAKTKAQNCNITLKITNENQQVVDKATILLRNQLVQTSDINGEAHLKLECGSYIVLKISHVAYLDESIRIAEFKKDTTILVKLRARVMQLPLTEIVAKIGPDTIIGNNKYYVEDYLFEGHYIYTLKRLRKSQQYFLALCDHRGNDIKSFRLDGKPKQLFKDALGANYLVYENKAFEITRHDTMLQQRVLDFSDFVWLYKFINQADEQHITMNNHTYHKPWFEYYLIDRNIMQNDTMHQVRHDFYYEQYHSEFRFLSSRERHALRRMEYETGISKYDLAAQYTGFSSNIWYKEVKAPYFYNNGKHYIFDFAKDSLLIFHKNGEKAQSIHFTFHHLDGFKEEIIFDEWQNTFYALSMKNGTRSLHKINIDENVSTSYVSKLSMRYPSNIKVQNGKVWYLSRPYESWQSTYLYAEGLE